jgi:gliding motility-associated protein GldE
MGIHYLSIDFYIEVLSLLILLILSGLFSASEVAFFSLRPAEKKLLETKKDLSSRNVLKCLENPEKLLATIIILNNAVNITIVILSTFVTSKVVSSNTNPVVKFIVEVVVITFVIVLVGEIIPKIFATKNTLRISTFMSNFFRVMIFLLNPIIYPLVVSSNIVNRRMRKVKPNISVKDLSGALEITSSSLKDEKKILEGIVKFGNIEVCQIMRPRIDIVAVNYDDNYGKILKTIIDSGYSRIPVFENTLDNIKGIILAKDLLPYIDEKPTFNWHALIKPPYFVPETKKIDDLLAEFQENKVHLAIVVDEHGGISGIVTMEDILEEIIGDIKDESDSEEEQLYKRLSTNSWLFEAKISINDFCKILQISPKFFDEVKGGYETIAGFILELKGEIPPKGEKLFFKNLTFEIESVDMRRIRQVKVYIN